MRKTLIVLASALSFGSAHVLASEVPSTGDSSVFLSIWSDGGSNPSVGGESSDYGTNRTLVVDTQLQFSDLIYNPGDVAKGPYTVDIDALVSAATSYSSVTDIFDTPLSGDMYMQVVAFDGLLTQGAIGGDYAVMTSVDGSVTGSNVSLANSVVSADQFYGFVGSSNARVTTTENGDVTHDDSWGDNFGGSWSGIDNAVAFSTNDADTADALTLNMAFIRTGGNGGNGENLDINTFSAPYTAAFDFATGDLVITTAAVPVPAAVWLFGSAMAGLIGFSRRSSGTIAAS